MLPNISALASYGGALKNYSDPVDPTTDEHVKYRNWYTQDTAGMTHTSARAIVSFVSANGANPNDPGSGFIHDAVWGNISGVKPVVARTGEGIWTCTWPQTVQTDLFDEDEDQGGGAQAEIALNFRRAFGQCQCHDGTLRHVAADVTSPFVVTVRGFLANGTPDDLTGQIVTVWVF